ncbi:efflux RND transporter permease subunit [Pararcticibacter amylolyticus]|uniref:AcrB/AcrD/AcrF family protein n=1 Tax=Pararcticibacter amylolyticus TaxID=2173175 RepID=A0A2U2PAE6_9SPHI|nr:efflux RND transporter permease subunit [Pararcticibacter amylolyticus]PWG78352.1 AcrB/AcrD/AcrF family protein [Pararcticibacter amylolyticus]
MKKSNTIIEAAIKYKQLPLTLAAVLVIFGIYALFNMPRNEFPEFTIRQGLIVGYFPGATSSEVEEQLTSKVEQYLFSFEEVDKKKTYSYSRDGQMYIYVEITEKPGPAATAAFWNKLKNGVLLMKGMLPQGVQAIVVNSDFGSTSAVLLAVESSGRPYKDLEKHVNNIEDELRKIPGLSRISHTGSLREQICVYLDNNKLNKYGISTGMVMQALQKQGGVSATGELKGGTINIPVHTQHLYANENDVAAQIIKTDEEGHILRLKDVAKIRREYQEPESFISTNGTSCIVISMEMQKGKNIVHFGREVDERLKSLSHTFPADIKLTKLADQPVVVAASINHFMKEFGIALVSVIIVTMLLLPFRVAAVASATIPITICATLSIMYALGLELNTVTLAALIIVLGIVVDDPIVVIDNHVEKLDEGLSIWESAVRSARELFPSVFTATLTIIATFTPLILFMVGVARDFVFDFPFTIIIALVLSLIISMLIVPYFNTIFIKKGLHDHSKPKEQDPEKKKSLLDTLQKVYNRTIELSFRNSWIVILLALAAVAGGALMLAGIPQQLFPKVDRNQFAVEIYLPSGYNLKETSQAVKQFEGVLARDKRVVHYTSFTGTSSPRFHTVYAPNLPARNYAQILVNTTSEEATEEILTEYEEKYRNMIPDAYIRMKQLTMISTQAPIEVRISGDSIPDLRAVAEKVVNIARKNPDNIWVRTDYEEKQQGIRLNIHEDEAARLGFSKSDISDAIAMNLQGLQATQVWEGDYAVDVIIKTPEEERRKAGDLNDLYITSPLMHQSVPLRQIASLVPDWTNGQIARRNGVRTLTVRIDTYHDLVPADVLSTFKDQIDHLPLPEGVSVSYGGEREEMLRNIGPMGLSLLLSVIVIFLILLFHFTRFKLAALSLITMPLSLFGAALGLLLMNYPFGFTSFIGLLSLCGIVVRNGIILIDYAEELRKHHGLTVREAAIAAGERRLRPIFLTSAAAAVGVVPMIISRSSLWGPLGTVICFGLLFSMVLTLLVLPVLYWLFLRKEDTEAGRELNNN